MRFTNQKDVIAYIDYLIERYQNKETLIQDAKFLKIRKPKQNLLCKIIETNLFKEGFEDYKELTIWRYLKIRSESKELTEKVKNGELKIKQAYLTLYPEKNKEKNIIDVDNPIELCKALYNEINNNFDSYTEKEMLDIDSELFRIRKLIGDKFVERLEFTD